MAYKNLKAHGQGDTAMNKWLLAAIAITLISSAYWSAFVLNQFNTFHTYWDLGLYTLDYYYHINLPSTMPGLQYLSFGNHLSITAFTLLPFYALFQAPQTLLIIQALITSLTGLLIYFIAKDLLKSEKAAFILCLAYLLNAGIFGIYIFDFHLEMFCIPLLLLSFYLYMKESRLYWVALILLLGTMEFTPVIAFFFGLAMLIYQLRYSKSINKRKLIYWALITMVLSVIALGLYYLGYQALISAYKAGEYKSLPTPLKDWQQLSSGNVAGIGLLIFTSISHDFYALCLVFLGFGITAIILTPDIALTLAFPWLAEAFIIGNLKFVRIWYYYFAFAIGGSVIAAILSLKILREKAEDRSQKTQALRAYALPLIAILAILLLCFMPIQVYSKNVNEVAQEFMFLKPKASTQIAQLKYVISQVPSNASMLTQYYIVDHLVQRKQVDILSDNFSWYKPEYVLIDFNDNLSLSAGNNSTQSPAFLSIKDNYTLITQNGSAQLYKLKLLKPANMR